MYLTTPTVTIAEARCLPIEIGTIVRVFLRRTADDHFIIGEVSAFTSDRSLIQLTTLALFKHGQRVPFKSTLAEVVTPGVGRLPDQDGLRAQEGRPGRIQIMYLCDGPDGKPSPLIQSAQERDTTGLN